MYKLYAWDGWDNKTLIWQSDVDAMDSGIYGGKLKLELNKVGSLSFTVSTNHFYYAQFQRKKTHLTLIFEDLSGYVHQLFKGRIGKIEIDTFRQKKITGESMLSFLADTVHIAEKSSDKKTYNAVTEFRALIEEHNSQMASEPAKQFDIGQIGFDENTSHNTNGSETLTDILSTLESEIIKFHGGYFKESWDETNHVNYLSWVKTFGRESTQVLEFGKQIASVSESEKSDEVFSVLVSAGDNYVVYNATTPEQYIVSVTGADGLDHNVNVVATGCFFEIPEAIERYGRIIHSEKFSGVGGTERRPNPSELLEPSLEYIRSNYKPELKTYNIKAVDLHLLDESVDTIYLGDIVSVIPEKNGSVAKMTCTSVEYDLQSPENTTYTIGVPEQTLTQKYTSASKRSSASGQMSDEDRMNINWHKKQIHMFASDDLLFSLEDGEALFQIEQGGRITTKAKSMLTLSDYLLTEITEEDYEKLNAFTERNKDNELVTTFYEKIFGKQGFGFYGGQDVRVETLEKVIAQNTAAISANATALRSVYTTHQIDTKFADNKALIDALSNELSTFQTSTYATDLRQTSERISGVATRTVNLENQQGETIQTIAELQSGFDIVNEHSELFTKALGLKRDANGDVVTHEETRVDDEGHTYTVVVPEFDSTQANPLISQIGTDYNKAYLASALMGPGNSILSKAYMTANGYTGEILIGAINTRNGSSSVRIEADNIDLTGAGKVIIRSINNSGTGTVKIQADKIELEGLVTAEALGAQIANIDDLLAGRVENSSIASSVMHAKSAFYFRNNLMGYRSLYIGSKSISYFAKAAADTFNSITTVTYNDLPHSHTVTVNNDGTVTLGSVTAANSGGNFRIADTKVYKEAVSAARTAGAAEVTLSTPKWSKTTDLTTTNTLTVTASNGVTVSQSIYLKPGAGWDSNNRRSIYVSTSASGGKNVAIRTLDATPVFNKGKNSVSVSSVAAVGAATFSPNHKTVYRTYRISLSNNVTYDSDISINVTDSYNTGVNSVTVSNVAISSAPTFSADYKTATANVTGTASNGKTKTSSVSYDITAAWNSAHLAGWRAVAVDTIEWDSIGTGQGNASNTVTAQASNGQTKSQKVNMSIGTVSISGSGSDTSANTHILLKTASNDSILDMTVPISVSLGDANSSGGSLTKSNGTISGYVWVRIYGQWTRLRSISISYPTDPPSRVVHNSSIYSSNLGVKVLTSSGKVYSFTSVATQSNAYEQIK